MLDATAVTYLVVFFAIVFSAPPTVKSIMLYRKRGRFRCTMCGNCCRLRIINLAKEDIVRLQAAGNKDFVAAGGEPRLRRVRGKCIFLKDDRCLVHEHRPKVCREFPFFKVWGVGYAREASFCPAMERLQNE